MPDDGIARPRRGGLTFDAEGQEGGRYHSRRPHVPGPTSGLTIGRGYDMKHRSRKKIRDDLAAAGVELALAERLSGAAGLAGDAAKAFMAAQALEGCEITPEAQARLFEATYEQLERDTRRLATKADVTETYGATDWDRLHPAIREVLVDLRYRGDYTSACRRFLQRHVASNDLVGFAREMCDRARWPKVPEDRFGRRKAFCEAALQP